MKTTTEINITGHKTKLKKLEKELIERGFQVELTTVYHGGKRGGVRTIK